MDNEKVIEIRNDEERRHYARRREDRGERKWALLNATAIIYAATLAGATQLGTDVHIDDCILVAERLLEEIESREAEPKEPHAE